MPVKLRNSPRALFYKALRVACFANRQRRIHENFNKTPFPHALTHHLPLSTVRGDKRGQHHQPGISHQAGDFPDPANVLFAVFIAKAQIATQAVTHIVTIEQVSTDTLLM
jgi:hypothetical protein